MVVEFVSGNLFDAEVDALVNTVNTKGVMGKGVALQFKRAFPQNFEAYKAACAADEVKLGLMFVTQTGQLQGPRWIINFPTKGHWKSRSRIADIEAGLQDLRRVLVDCEISSVAIPPLGCGLGGLDWSVVRPRIAEALADLPLRAAVFAPDGAPPAETMAAARERPPLTPFRATLLWVLDRYLLPGEAASPLEIQKLLYFLQEAGLSLGLTFTKNRYGPYADAARRAVVDMEGHFLIGSGDGTGAGGVRLLPGALDEAQARLAKHPETRAAYERVAALIDGFETPYGLELLATAHWVATRERVEDAAGVAARVRAWSARKQSLYTDHHVAVAWDRLESHGWLHGQGTLAPV